ncbi:MAG TPA: hypothetical protein VMW18_15365 [Candidatus Binatia bacterium]|nr:hypothetical protein [Candidatus Binatia bacterium]
MIEEYRRLTFSMDELATAVLSYLIATKKMTERDKMGRIAITGGDDVGVAATIVTAGGEQSQVELTSQTLGALLIAHCIKRKVPLPKRASKSILRNGDRLALVLSI